MKRGLDELIALLLYCHARSTFPACLKIIRIFVDNGECGRKQERNEARPIHDDDLILHQLTFISILVEALTGWSKSHRNDNHGMPCEPALCLLDISR